jgi:hypothetical protein
VVEQFTTNFNNKPVITDVLAGIKFEVERLFTARPLLSVNAQNSLELNVPVTVSSEKRADRPGSIALSTIIGLQFNVVEEDGIPQLEIVEP